MGRTRLVSGLEAARVGSLVSHHHSFNLNGELTVVVVHQGDAGVQGPLICAREQDVGAVQPCFVSDLFINLASEGKRRFKRTGLCQTGL